LEMICLNKSCYDGWLIDKFDDLRMKLYSMHPDDLKAIWTCHECHRIFVFHSDVDDHKDSSGHKMINKMALIIPAEPLA
jgi:hypothetical protein